MRYKPKLDAALRIGLVDKTREKRQRGNRHGRPRTYAVRLPMAKPDRWNLNFDQALDYLKTIVDKKSTSETASVSVNKVTRMCLSPLGGEGTSWMVKQAIVKQSRCDTGVIQDGGSSETTNRDTSDHRSPHHASKPEQHLAVIASPKSETTTNPTVEQSGGSYEPAVGRRKADLSPLGVGSERLRSTSDRDPPGNNRGPGLLHPATTPARPRRASGAHQGCTREGLAAREKKLLAQQEVVPRFRYPTPSRQPAADAIHRAQQYLDAEAAALRAGAEGPTPNELAAIPQNDLSVIKVILAARRRDSSRLSHRQASYAYHELAAAQQVLESTVLNREETWLLLAKPDRLSPSDHYRRAKLLNNPANPKNPPESITVSSSIVQHPS